jgi:putative salt-induced outer membrane protein YdiY
MFLPQNCLKKLMFRLRSPDCFCILPLAVAGLFGCAAIAAASGPNVVLRLSSGDQISGTIISENTNRIVLSNSWNVDIAIPMKQIVSRSTNAAPALTGAESTETLLFSEAKPRAESTVNNAESDWRGEAQVGMDFLYGAKERQIFYGRFKLSYQKPYKSNAEKFFRNGFDYTIDYGRTFGETSSDRMRASNKTSFDLVDKWYVYSLVAGGYDHILHIDSQYEAGPGVGYHLLTHTNFAMNVELGLNYQAQYRRDNSEIQDVYYRLAEDVTWKIWDRLSLIEKLEFFPRVNLTGYRIRFESTLKYDLWKNLALNLTLLDLYDTDPAEEVAQNEFQIRSSIGLKF